MIDMSADMPMFAGLSDIATRPQDEDQFHIRGIAVETEPCPDGFDENDQLVDMGGVTVDRFDCRLLLDPLELRMILKADRGHDEGDFDDLDEIRYGDLYDGGTLSSPKSQGVCGAGEYGAVAFSYDAPSTKIDHGSLIPPPPPYARAIVEQSLKGSIPPPSSGPMSLRQLAVMSLVAKYTAGLERDGASLEHDSVFRRFEFVDNGHGHHIIFRDMVDRWKDAAVSSSSVKEESKPESIAMLLEYHEEDDEDYIPVKEKLSMRAIRCMMNNMSLRKDAEAFLIRVKSMHGDGGLFQATPEKSFHRFIEDLEDHIAGKKDSEDEKTTSQDDYGNKITCDEAEETNAEEEEEEDPFAQDDEGVSIDDAKLAERRRKAQMMLKKRKQDYEEKTKLLRKRTVEHDRLLREQTVSTIQQHRKMFQDSDEED